MSDRLIWGNARPLFRIGSTRYVLNDPPANIRIIFDKKIILNESITGKLYEHVLGYRGRFAITWEYLDRPSTEALINILNESPDIYMRPHFNFCKEYKVRPVRGFNLERFGKIYQPYKGTIEFETIELEDEIPTESKGAFIFDGSTNINTSFSTQAWTNTSVEFWLKTPSSFSSQVILKLLSSGSTVFEVGITSAGKIYISSEGSTLSASTACSTDTWYHVICKKANTSQRRIILDGEYVGADDDGSTSALNFDEFKLGNSFTGDIQIARLYNVSLYQNFEKQMSEVIQATPFLWWDFSQGNADDLSGNGYDGTVTGTEAYSEESFPDRGYKLLT